MGNKMCRVQKAYIAFGSNLGDRLTHVTQAIDLIKQVDRVVVTRVSSIYETEPVGYVEQSSFLNGVLAIETSLSPMQLLKTLQEIEKRLKRERLMHWGPRTIDLDILLYDQWIIKEENLIIPHPYMLERAFVLIPLLEIAPELIMPDGQAVQAFLTSSLQQQAITKLGSLDAMHEKYYKAEEE